MLTNSRNFNHSYLTTIEEDRTYHGIFWLPDHPENRVSGVLYLKKSDGVSLKLIGMFESDASIDLGLRLVEHQSILGELLPGSSIITLIGCKETERQSPYFHNTSKSATQRFIADGALFNTHLNSAEELKFSSFEFSTLT